MNFIHRFLGLNLFYILFFVLKSVLIEGAVHSSPFYQFLWTPFLPESNRRKAEGMRALRRKRKEAELAALANGEIIVKIGKRRTPKRLKLDPTSSIPNPPPPVCIVQVEEQEQEEEEIFQDDQDQEEVDYITRLTTTTSSYVQEEDTPQQDHHHSPLPEVEEVADNDCPPPSVKILPEVESPDKELLIVPETDEIQERLEEEESRDEPVQENQTEPESTQEEEPQSEFFNLVQEMNDILWAIPPQQQVAAAMECLKYVKMVARTIDLIP